MQQENSNKIIKKNNKSVIKKIGKRIFQIFVITVITVALFFFGLTNSTTFRQFVVSKITNIANNFLEAEIQISDIRFNRINGFSIENLKIITANDTLANVEKTIIDINFEKLFFQNQFAINSLELKNPKIKLLRSEIDSIWNFNRIVKPSEKPKDTTVKEPSQFSIAVRSLKIENGSFTYWDSTVDWKSSGKIHFSQMAWENLNVNLQNTLIDVGNSIYSTKISSVAAKEIHSEMDIKKLKTNAKLSKNGIEALNSQIEFENTVMNFDAEMRNFNVFGEREEREISKAIMSIDMNLKNFNPEFIDNFAFIPVEIGFVKNMTVQAKGTLEEMLVPKITVNIANSYIEVENARTTNLLNPEKLTYEATLNSTFIRRSDFPNILKNIDLTAVPNFFHMQISNSKFFGTLDSVGGNFNLRTGIGTVNGNAGIVFSAEPMRYFADLKTTNLNIANLANNQDLQSKINANVKINGEDFEPQKMKATVDLEINNSQIRDFFISNSKVFLDYSDENILKIDEFFINFIHNKNTDFDDFLNNLFPQNSKITVAGEVNLSDFDSPKINLNADFENINFSAIFDDEILPTEISTTVKINSEGIDIDKMKANISLDFSGINFANKSMIPFKIDAEINTNVEEKSPKMITVTADNIFGKVMELRLRGDFSLEVFTDGIAKKFEQITNYISNRIDGMVGNFVKQEELTQREIENLLHFPNSKFDLFLEARTLYFLDFFIDSLQSNSANIYARIKYNSNENSSHLNVERLRINSLDLNYKGIEILVDRLRLISDFSVKIIDSIPKISDMQIDLSVRNMLRISGINIDSLRLLANFENGEYCFNFQAIYDSLFVTKLEGYFKTDENDIHISFDSLVVIYENEKWFNNRQIQIGFDRHGLTFNRFEIARANKERISISGGLQDEKIDNIKLFITNFEFNDLNNLIFSRLGIDNIPIFSQLDSLNIWATGTLQNPKISSHISMKNVRFERQFIGHFRGEFTYENEQITGRSRIYDRLDTNLFFMRINSLPIYLGTDSTKTLFFDDRPLDISMRLRTLPAQLFSPFVPEVDNFSGNLTGRITVGGFLPDSYKFDGNVALENVGFRIVPTNMEYTAFGNVDISEKLIEIKEMKVRNRSTDLRNGEATVTGKIAMENFELKHIDINLASRQFKILSDRTALSMPWFYGRMVIATEERPLRFHGTLTEPNLDGTVTILSADMKMPNVLAEEIIRREQKFNYIHKDTLRITITSIIDSAKLDSLTQLKEARRNEVDFIDLLNINLSIRIRQFSIALDLGRMGKVFARIGTVVPRTPIQYVKNRNEEEAKIFGGELAILDGSTVQIYRTMSARGTISFPSARISRPELNLVAVSRIKDQNTNTNYTVEVKVTGTPEQPKINFSYSIEGILVTGDSIRITNEAIMLLMTGTLGGGSSGGNLLNESGNWIASQFASQTLTELLLHTGYIQSANLKFEGDGFNNADISISGSLAGVATWTIGGRIQDISSNYNISIDFPITINNYVLNNILLQISKATDIYNSNFDRNAKDWEVRLRFGGHW